MIYVVKSADIFGIVNDLKFVFAPGNWPNEFLLSQGIIVKNNLSWYILLKL